MSRIDFTPEQTTTIGVSASTSRSADTSKVSAARRWTPPRPPVANTRIPPAAAIAAVAATVVAPSRRSAYAGARSRRDSLTSSVLQTRSSSSPVRPILGSPSRTAIVAGTAPAARMVSSRRVATLRLRPGGRPWARIVLSSATIAPVVACASRTSSVISTVHPLSSGATVWVASSSRVPEGSRVGLLHTPRGRLCLQGTVDVGVGGADVAADVEGRALVRVERAPVVEVQSGDGLEQRDVVEEGGQQGRALRRGQRRALALLPLQTAP